MNHFSFVLRSAVGCYIQMMDPSKALKPVTDIVNEVQVEEELTESSCVVRADTGIGKLEMELTKDTLRVQVSGRMLVYNFPVVVSTEVQHNGLCGMREIALLAKNLSMPLIVAPFRA